MSKKLGKAFDAMRESNRLYLEDMKEKEAREKEPSSDPSKNNEEEADKAKDLIDPEDKAKEYRENNKAELEKGDVPALIISAMIVFGPVFLILAALVVLAWIFLH